MRRVCEIEVGKLGTLRFPRGFYVYTGSALGAGSVSLQSRIARHLSRCKKKRWHIDYLLNSENAAIISAISANSSWNRECEINLQLERILESETVAAGFGSSDCSTCESHLQFVGQRCPENEVNQVYRETTGSTNCLVNPRVTDEHY